MNKGILNMEYNFSKRLENFKTSIFTVLNEKKNELLRDNRKVYNLSVGTPDFEPQPHIKQALIKAAEDSDNWKYSLNDMDELLDSVCKYYKKRFNTEIEHNEIMSIYGSQEGLTHIGLALCDPGDIVLIPNPGYPIFEIGPSLCGAKIVYYSLLPENNYLPDFSELDESILYKAKFMIVSYPMNPVCAVAPPRFYEQLIEFANKYNILILHDNAYSDIIFDGNEGKSFLSYKGAKEVGVEFFSLSKSFNFTGARLSFVIGNKSIIDNFKILRSQIDYGIFKPIQYAAIAALNGPQDSVQKQCIEYENRRNALCDGLTKLGWNVSRSKGSMFVWAKIPEKYSKSFDFCLDLIEKTGVICTPGSEFGSLGEGYVRFALVLPVDKIKEAILSIDKSGMLK